MNSDDITGHDERIRRTADKTVMNDREILEEPRHEVTIDEERSGEFADMVDNPKYNPKVAKLFREAEETFPEE